MAQTRDGCWLQRAACASHVRDSPVPVAMTASGFLNLVGALGVHADAVFSVSFNIWLSFSFFFGLVFFLFRFRSVATISAVLLCVYSFEFCACWVLQPSSRRNLLI